MPSPLEACQYPHASGHAYKTIPRQLETEVLLLLLLLFVHIYIFFVPCGKFG